MSKALDGMPNCETKSATCFKRARLKSLFFLTASCDAGTEPVLGQTSSSNSAPKLNGKWSEEIGVLFYSSVVDPLA